MTLRIPSGALAVLLAPALVAAPAAHAQEIEELGDAPPPRRSSRPRRRS